MNTLEFLQRVLPTEGVYCTFFNGPRGKVQRFHDTLEAAEAAIQRADGVGQNTFFAVSTFLNGSSRRKTNVAYTKVLAIDVDCGADKPFDTWKDGLKALHEFIKVLKLPVPLVIRSGNGLHVYWVLDEELTREQWEPMAYALKEATRQQGFKVDASLVGNPSQVLRPVGTRNHKDIDNPKPVTVLLDRGDTTVAVMRKALSYYTKVSTGPRKPSPLLDSLAVTSDLPAAVASVVERKCAQINWAVANQDEVPEPMWYAMIGVAAACEDPEGTAIAWSKNHPGYSEEETLRKLHQWKAQTTGPATCAKFDSERPEGCKGCPYAGRIGSPASLGTRYKEIDTSANAPENAVTTIPLPKNHKRSAAGIAVTIDETDVLITDFDIYPLSYGYDETLGYEVAQYLWDRRHVGWRLLTLRQAHLADGTYKEFVTSIADQGIMLETKKQTEYFQMMLRSYMNELRKVRTVTNLYSTMGWKEDNKVFVLGETVYRRTDTGVEEENLRLASTTARAGTEMFTVKGSYDKWRAGTELLGKTHLYAHQFSIGIALASVLVPFTGLKGATVSFYGPSGSGKSQAQLVQQSVWGDPEKLHFQSKFTPNALFNRFGTHGNLPITVDEATQMSDSDVGDMLYWVSQGRDKARLTKTSEERAPREWALLATMSTNKPLATKLMSLGDENEAQMLRLLELKVETSKLFANNTTVGRMFHRLFTENCGHAGREFIHNVMENYDEADIQNMFRHAAEELCETYDIEFNGTERYWELVLVLVALSLRLAYEWDIIKFDPKWCIKWAVSQLDAMRNAVEDERKDLLDLVNEYITEHSADMVELYRSPGREYNMNDLRPMPRGPVRVRVEGDRKRNSTEIAGGRVYLDRTHFRRWYASRGGNPRTLHQDLMLAGALADQDPNFRISLAKNTGIRLPQCYALPLRLTHPKLKGLLDDVSMGSQEAEVVKLHQSEA